MAAKERVKIDAAQWPEVVAFAENFAAARKERGISQKEVADKTGLPQSYVSSLENGFLNPTLQVQAALTRAIGVALASVTYTRRVHMDVKGEISSSADADGQAARRAALEAPEPPPPSDAPDKKYVPRRRRGG